MVLLLWTFCLLSLPLWESVIVLFCCTLLYVHSSIAIILLGKRELVALLNFSSWCLLMVEWLFLTVPWGCLRFVIVVFPEHTHLLFFTEAQLIDSIYHMILKSFCDVFGINILEFTIWASMRGRPACAAVQSDQCLCYSLFEKYRM